MGVVLVAYDPDLDRRVALKLLKPQYGRVGLLLRREAQALAKLTHPNVVAVHDVGEHRGRVFVTMEYVEGQTLRRWLEQDPRPDWSEILRMFLAAGRGLAAAHAQGLIHRDFKPDNVMIGKDGRVRVMDFGLARADRTTDERELEIDDAREPATSHGSLTSLALTRTGALTGTPAYMAPEQF
ncbi:MAG: serine/threonine protein kinase, partial [Myxococcales bacterium]|nr:serine/threonine protein kinase [Myxococcales bacterium]